MISKYRNIPQELKMLNQWVVWGIDKNNLKCPYKPTSLFKASAGKPETWSNFHEAQNRVKTGQAKGVGFEFHDNGIYGVDLDNVIVDDELTSEAREIVNLLDSYTELSPSGKGLHIIVKAENIQLEANRKGFLEIYNKNRYFTMTGKVYGDLKPIQDRTEALEKVYNKYLKPKPAIRKNTSPQTPESANLYKDDKHYFDVGLEKDSTFADLWNGARPKGDESADDQSLFNKLAYWCNKNTNLMEEMFFVSPHYSQKDNKQKKKCDREDYIQRTIKTAIEGVQYTARDKDQAYKDTQVKKDFSISFKEDNNIIEFPKQEKSKFKFIDPFATSETRRRYAWNDIGCGYLFADNYKNYSRYVPEMKSWFCFQNGVWKQDIEGLKVSKQGKNLTNYLTKLASRIEDEKTQEQYIKFLSKRIQKKYRDTMISDAKSEYPISINEFDKNDYQLNCKNGTLNLKTMEFKDHDPNDFISKITNADYDPNSKCERWEKFLDEVFCGDAELSKFFQKIIGYCITGDTSLECMFILYGATTRNGKGTSMETILNVLGDYAKTAQPETLGERMNTNSNNASEDIARLKGARLVNIPEPRKKLMLDVAKVKQLTGGDTVTARFLHQNSFEYKPNYKFVIHTNHLPTVNDDTLFKSGRVYVVPFNRHFKPEERDETLKTLFAKEENTSAILNWCVEGYRLLTVEGLKPPKAVIEATQEYEDNSDIIGLFLEETFVTCSGIKIKTKEVYEKYTNWCNENGNKAMSNKNLIDELRKRGMIKRINSMGNVMYGYDFIKEGIPDDFLIKP